MNKVSDDVSALQRKVQVLEARVEEKQRVIYAQAGRINEIMLTPGVMECLRQNRELRKRVATPRCWLYVCVLWCWLIGFFKAHGLDPDGRCKKSNENEAGAPRWPYQ
jgi:hypothetical protein